MKLAEWARQQGLDYKTAYRWFRAGILPVPSKQLPTATILVEPVPLAEKRGAAVYARVSSGDEKNQSHSSSVFAFSAPGASNRAVTLRFFHLRSQLETRRTSLIGV